MAGMVGPGCIVHMTVIPETKKSAGNDRRCTHSVAVAEDVREDSSRAAVCCHPMLAERAVGQALQRGLLPGIGPGWVKVSTLSRMSVVGGRLTATAQRVWVQQQPRRCMLP